MRSRTTEMIRRTATWLTLAALAFPGVAHADSVALLEPVGSDVVADRDALHKSILDWLATHGHSVVDPAAVEKARTELGITDRSPAALVSLAGKIGCDWVLSPSQDPAVTTTRVELSTAYQPSLRFESVAREVDRAAFAAQVGEMLAVILRPEGVGTNALPWETRTAPPPKTEGGETDVKIQSPETEPPRPETPDPARPFGSVNHFFVGAGLGFDAIAVQPEGGAGDRFALNGAIKGGYAIAETGLEVGVQVAGHLAGPGVVFVDASVRWNFPLVGGKGGTGLYMGPLVHGGLVVFPGSSGEAGGKTYETPTEASGSIAGSLDLAIVPHPNFEIEAQLGEARILGTPSGAAFVTGANVLAGARF